MSDRMNRCLNCGGVDTVLHEGHRVCPCEVEDLLAEEEEQEFERWWEEQLEALRRQRRRAQSAIERMDRA